MLKIIVGLGNPGSQYLINRHNVGFMMIDVLADMYQAPAFKRHGQVLMADVKIGQHKVLLAKPQSFMNLSGHAISPLLQFFKISLEDMLVIHDDVDLNFNKIRIKQGGGHGGHNGLRNLDTSVGNNYWRLRFGVDHPGHKDAVSGYVLSNFSKGEQEYLINTLSNMARAINYLIDLNADGFIKEISTGQ